MSEMGHGNPFPGVNPYIEWEGYREDFHGTFVPCLRECIVDALPERYDARVEERMLVLTPDRKEQRRPDVVVSERTDARKSKGGASTVVASPGAAAIVELLPFDVIEETQKWIDILDLEDESIVTSIEVLSPSNKDSRGSEPFHGKRQNLLLAGVHWIDIDLLLGGGRFRYKDPLPPGHFYAFVTRAPRRPRASEVFPWSLRDPLPRIPIPLREPDPDITVDLGEAYRLAFERGRYPRRLRYRQPSPPLGAPDREWVAATAAGAARA
ncbi:MAG: DUF4058 family protein [Tepidisphaeraceae bacterium]